MLEYLNYNKIYVPATYKINNSFTGLKIIKFTIESEVQTNTSYGCSFVYRIGLLSF